MLVALAKTKLYAKIGLEKYSGFVSSRFASLINPASGWYRSFWGQEYGGKNIPPALHFHAPIFLPIPNRTTSPLQFLA
jgi:hypothetical protein